MAPGDGGDEDRRGNGSSFGSVGSAGGFELGAAAVEALPRPFPPRPSLLP